MTPEMQNKDAEVEELQELDDEVEVAIEDDLPEVDYAEEEEAEMRRAYEGLLDNSQEFLTAKASFLESEIELREAQKEAEQARRQQEMEEEQQKKEEYAE